MSQEQERVAAIQGAPATPSECTHHWVIDTPSGPMSRGQCKLCGAEREFKNFLDNTPYWEDDVYLDQVSSGSQFRTNEAAEGSSDTVGE